MHVFVMVMFTALIAYSCEGVNGGRPTQHVGSLLNSSWESVAACVVLYHRHIPCVTRTLSMFELCASSSFSAYMLLIVHVCELPTFCPLMLVLTVYKLMY